MSIPASTDQPRRALRRRPLIIAHRGGAPSDIENSLGAFSHGLHVGADLIECDLRTSADGVVVLYHDPQIDGVPVTAIPLAELRRLVPTLLTLDEFVDWANRRDPLPGIVFDFKERRLERRVAWVFHDPRLRRRTIVTTQHTWSIRRLRTAFPDLRVGLSRGQAAAGANPPRMRPWIAHALRPILFLMLLVQLRWSRATAVAIFHRLATPQTVRRLHRAGVRVYVWTVDNCDDMWALAQREIDLLATNDPEKARRCLDPFWNQGTSSESG
jgi:glycerophosphoryl diester phosphodiesterase